jgi:fructose-1,6-bisphosphatase/inositol monophosphatase family enzyme
LADVSAGGVHNRILGDNLLRRDAVLLVDTVRDAGALALSLFRTELKNWTKGASSPVSEADIAVNDLLEGRLRSATPAYGWLSEESADDETRLSKYRVWIVDPIDGTRGYLAGREDWCVSAALVEDGSPLLAAVFAPASDEFFLAARAHGAALNDVRFLRRLALSWIFPAWPVRSRWSSGSVGHRAKSSFIRESDRWRCGCAGWRKEAWMRLLPAAKATTGTLPRPI